MPTISFFYGIVVQMHWREHNPPHFHAIYQGWKAAIEIETGEVIAGSLPPTARRILREWAADHREELLANWQRATLEVPFLSIPGADQE